MADSLNVGVTLPAEHYIGIRPPSQHSPIPLAFMTPDGKNQQATKRKHTVDKWVGTGHWKTDPNRPHCRATDDQGRCIWVNKVPDGSVLKTVTNELLSDFSISKEVRRTSSWNGGNVVWRVEDPRGFELEISSGNLARILDMCEIKNGVIQGKCIWGRKGKDNVLLPELSEPYINATQETIRQNVKLSLKDVNVGDVVQIQQLNKNAEFTYMGLFRLVLASGISYRYDNNAALFKDITQIQKRYIFKDSKDGKYWAVGTPKIHKLIKTGPLGTSPSNSEITAKRTEYCKEINDNLGAISSLAYSYGKVAFVTLDNIKPSDIEITLVPVDYETEVLPPIADYVSTNQSFYNGRGFTYFVEGTFLSCRFGNWIQTSSNSILYYLIYLKERRSSSADRFAEATLVTLDLDNGKAKAARPFHRWPGRQRRDEIEFVPSTTTLKWNKLKVSYDGNEAYLSS